MRRDGSALRAGWGRRTLLAAAASFLLAGCSSASDDQTRAEGQYQFQGTTAAGTVIDVATRAPAPGFTGELLDGTAFDSAELSGDITAINFWGSWCPPCRVETPELQAVGADLAGRGVRILGIDVKDERQLAVAFIREIGATYPSLFDPRGEVALAFRGFPANAVPSTILLDRRGRVAAVYTGAVRGQDLRQALSLLLEEGPGE